MMWTCRKPQGSSPSLTLAIDPSGEAYGLAAGARLRVASAWPANTLFALILEQWDLEGAHRTFAEQVTAFKAFKKVPVFISTVDVQQTIQWTMQVAFMGCDPIDVRSPHTVSFLDQLLNSVVFSTCCTCLVA
jgi:hypothetical protein